MFLGINSSAVSANIAEGESYTAAQLGYYEATQPAMQAICPPGAEPTSAFLALNLLIQAAQWETVYPKINALYADLDIATAELHTAFLHTEIANANIF